MTAVAKAIAEANARAAKEHADMQDEYESDGPPPPQFGLLVPTKGGLKPKEDLASKRALGPSAAMKASRGWFKEEMDASSKIAPRRRRLAPTTAKMSVEERERAVAAMEKDAVKRKADIDEDKKKQAAQKAADRAEEDAAKQMAPAFIASHREAALASTSVEERVRSKKYYSQVGGGGTNFTQR